MSAVDVIGPGELLSAATVAVRLVMAERDCKKSEALARVGPGHRRRASDMLRSAEASGAVSSRRGRGGPLYELVG